MKNLYTEEMLTQEHIEKPFDFTLSQLKQLAANGKDILEVTEALNAQPEWLLSMGGINDVSEIVTICKGGCAITYRPAVTDNTALAVMNKYGNDILEFIEDNIEGEFPTPKQVDSWSGMAVYYTSMAVELWAGGVVASFELDDLEY